ALDLLGQHAGILELAGRREVEQLVVRNAAPEEEGQPRSQLEVAQPVWGPGFHVDGLALEPDQELWRRQQRLERALDPAVEVALGAPFLVESHERRHAVLDDRTAIRPARQGGEDKAGA